MPRSDLARFKGEEATSCYFSTTVERTQNFLDEKCEFYDSPPLSVDEVMLRQDGSLNKGDFSIHVPQKRYPILNQHLTDLAESLKLELGDVYSDCKVIENCRLRLYLNRERAYRSCLRQLLSKDDESSSKNKRCRGKVLLIRYDDASTSLTNFRTHTVSEHIACILSTTGYHIWYRHGSIPDLKHVASTSTIYKCNCDCNSDQITFEKLCVNSSWCSVSNKNKNIVTLDAKGFLEQNPDRLRQYDKNLRSVHLVKGCYTECFKECAHLYHVLKTHAVGVDSVIFIVPVSKQFFYQQCSLVLEMVLERSLKFQHLVHQLVLHTGPECCTSELYTKQKHTEMEHALLQKYGESILSNKSWSSVVETVTNSAVKFDFLLTGPSVPLKINSRKNEFGIQDKGGAFVQYNSARLSTILKHFNEKLQAGIYKASPDIEDIDFTQLKLQEEWNLFFNYVFSFMPYQCSLVETMWSEETLQVNIPTHRVCNFLVSLSRDLSMYYNRNRVLVDPYPQLLARMYPRLCLIRAIHEVVKNSLALLNLAAVEKM